ncbi:hypothetical protein HU200_033534 [Digitaria exilis]|uniref:Uncharacterized protein n=1 Tax=Digitaria exilis TaxID=1010633 RepID=A0A835ER82_9POAL|nr:hypothetical protein HU200_033534 [Digitaria exilis]
MSAQAPSTVVPTDAELLQAQADLWRHSLYYLTSMALRCAVQLGIPTAIYHNGGAATVPDLITALSLPATKLPFLRRLMRLLAASGVLTVDNSGEEAIYRISPTSYLLVDGVADDGHINHSSIVLSATSTHCVEAALGFADWFKKDVVTPPFKELHGATLFHDNMEDIDEEYHRLANEALASHDNFGIDMALRQFSDIFEGIQSLTDCGGGDGTTARAIVKAFPHIKCTVLDLPEVIEKIPADGVINYVGGDMFKFVPPAQVVILKVYFGNQISTFCHPSYVVVLCSLVFLIFSSSIQIKLGPNFFETIFPC